MVNNDLDLKEIVKVISKNRKFIVYFTLIILALTLIISLVWPKTYESVSEIQLAQLAQPGQPITGSADIFSVIESKNIIESSSIIEPVLSKYSRDINYLDFIKDNLYVEILQETIGRDQKIINYLKVSILYKNPEITKKMNEEIINNFFEYAQPYYDFRYNVLIKGESEVNANIEQLEKDITLTENQIKTISNVQLTTEGVSKSTLLSDILSEYKSRLSLEQEKRIDIENKLANKREYSMIGAPQIPKKPTSPNILLNLTVALFAGLFLSILIAFIGNKYYKLKSG